MNQSRSQSMYADKRHDMGESNSTFNMMDKNNRSRSDDAYEQVLQIFMSQTVCYLQGNLN